MENAQSIPQPIIAHYEKLDEGFSHGCRGARCPSKKNPLIVTDDEVEIRDDFPIQYSWTLGHAWSYRGCFGTRLGPADSKRDDC